MLFVELSLPNKGTTNDVSSLLLIRSLSIRCATNRQRTKTKTLRFEWVGSKNSEGNKRQLERKQGGPTSRSSRATKTHSSWFFSLDYAWSLKI